jgi:cell wall assembly regulator SMI1
MVDESIQPAEWDTPVPAEVLDQVEQMLGVRLPEAWRAYVRRDRWLRRGWLESGDYVQLHAPDEALALMAAWGAALELHPGFYPLGGDGSRDMYCVDPRPRPAGAVDGHRKFRMARRTPPSPLGRAVRGCDR